MLKPLFPLFIALCMFLFASIQIYMVAIVNSYFALVLVGALIIGYVISKKAHGG